MKKPAEIEFPLGVLRDVRRHCRREPHHEVCGVLVGKETAEGVVVEAAIEGSGSVQTGARVTFTQDTWAHIYKIKDAQYPDHRIVGWYHSHPGFGIFLSEHDAFIQQNFFSAPGQVAFVYDPESDEEGCFGWRNGKLERLRTLRLRDEQGGTVEVRPEPETVAPGEEPQEQDAGPRRLPRWARWVTYAATHLAALLAGALLGMILAPRDVVFVPVNPSQQGQKIEQPGALQRGR